MSSKAWLVLEKSGYNNVNHKLFWTKEKALAYLIDAAKIAYQNSVESDGKMRLSAFRLGANGWERVPPSDGTWERQEYDKIQEFIKTPGDSITVCLDHEFQILETVIE